MTFLKRLYELDTTSITSSSSSNSNRGFNIINSDAQSLYYFMNRLQIDNTYNVYTQNISSNIIFFLPIENISEGDKITINVFGNKKSLLAAGTGSTTGSQASMYGTVANINLESNSSTEFIYDSETNMWYYNVKTNQTYQYEEINLSDTSLLQSLSIVDSSKIFLINNTGTQEKTIYITKNNSETNVGVKFITNGEMTSDVKIYHGNTNKLFKVLTKSNEICELYSYYDEANQLHDFRIVSYSDYEEKLQQEALLQNKSSSFDAEVGMYYSIETDSAGGNISVIMPLASNNERVTFKINDSALNNSVIIAGGSIIDTIEGGATLTLDKPYQSATLVYNSAKTNWEII